MRPIDPTASEPFNSLCNLPGRLQNSYDIIIHKYTLARSMLHVTESTPTISAPLCADKKGHNAARPESICAIGKGCWIVVVGELSHNMEGKAN
ncbi:hypothetical protein WA026_017434 [Henosepilachna vigintioctopunctata]|uniref:Uncharacterized protein n=1 Tax=Henosepilachna vigintioctopunctata TaxID=420089 RepID=A0AAW1VFB7_9CUCU